MSKWRDFSPGVRLPSTWTDAIEEMLSTFVSSNFRVTKIAANTLRIPADAGHEVGAAIQGSPRWVTADVDAAVSGAAGIYYVWLTCTADTFTVGGTGDEVDTTDRSFKMRILPVGTSPSGTGDQALFRHVGTVIWDGAAIIQVTYFSDPTKQTGGTRRVSFNYGSGANDSVDVDIPHGLVDVYGNPVTPSGWSAVGGTIATFAGGEQGVAVPVRRADADSTSLKVRVRVLGPGDNRTNNYVDVVWIATA